MESLNVESIIMKNDELDLKDIEYLMYNTVNKKDFLTLNHIESRITGLNDGNFVSRSANKIQLLVRILLADKKDALYDYYRGTFEQYMEATNNSFEGITSFNLIFVTLVHISLKVIRDSADIKKGDK